MVVDHAFAEQSLENEQQAGKRLFGIPFAGLLHLRKQMRRPLNRPGDQVWEQADEQAILNKRPRGWKFARININDVGHFLEGVKRNSRRKDNSQHGQRRVNAQRGKRNRERVSEEVEILKKAQNRKIDDQRERQEQTANPRILCIPDFDGDQIVHDRGSDHQAEETPIPPTVEKIADEQKKFILM